MIEPHSKGLIQIYTGDGKGKTTAALGIALRASGHGLKVIFIQFIKGIATGEHKFIQKYLPFEIVQLSSGNCFQKNGEQLGKEVKQTLEFTREILLGSKYDMVILDEIFIALSQNLITTKDIMDLLDMKPDTVELVLTGRNAPPEIVQRADLVTEMLMIKHPFNEGITGRLGIEY